MANDTTGGSGLPFDAAVLDALRAALDASAPVIVELRLGNATHTPERTIFHRHETLLAYLRMVARPGDTIAAWRFDEVCRSDNTLLAAQALRAPE